MISALKNVDSRPAGWVKISTRTIFQHPRLNLVEDRVLIHGGAEIDYLRFENYDDYSTVIPITADGKILMINEYAYPINLELLQFPEGGKGSNETIEQAALRELEEEVGLRAEELIPIGHNLHHHRRSTAKNVVFIAKGLIQTSTNLDLEETGISAVLLEEKDVWKLIAAGKIIQKNTLAAWSMYQAHKKQTKP